MIVRVICTSAHKTEMRLKPSKREKLPAKLLPILLLPLYHNCSVFVSVIPNVTVTVYCYRYVSFADIFTLTITFTNTFKVKVKSTASARA